MSIPQSVQVYLTKHNVHYKKIQHEVTNTALANSTKLHCNPSDMAKVIVLKLDEMYAMFVLPSNEKIHIPTLKNELHVNKTHMLTESELRSFFLDCEVGAQPAMGSLYNIPTFLSNDLKSHFSLYFNGGTHTDVIEMETRDFIKLEKPGIFKFSFIENEYNEYKETFYFD